MRRAILTLLTAIILLSFTSEIIGQKIKYLPRKFLAPISLDNPADNAKFVNESGKRAKGERWIVVSDRDKNKLYEKPNGNLLPSTLAFGEPMYVIKEKNEWIQVANGPRKSDVAFDEIRKKGWIKKESVLLWPYALRDGRTGITKKAFLLNKAERISRILKESSYQSVKVYNGSSSSKEIDNKGIYNVYFVMKEEGGRSLLSATDYLSNEVTIMEYLIGWVDNSRIEKWNQRLTLECNWDESSVKQRRSSNKFVIGFKDEIEADSYSKFGVKPEGVLWDNDPAQPGFNYKLLSEENEYRAIGSVFRFPVFNTLSGYINSGAINSIPTRKPGSNEVDQVISESEMIQFKDLYEKNIKPKRFNVNVGFLIEGSKDMGSYKGAILAAIESVNDKLPTDVNIKYGAMVYRDSNLEDENKDVEIKRLTTSKRSVVDFVNNIIFDDYTDIDEYTNLRYALSSFVNKGGFSSQELNIIICIGNGADFSYDFARRQTAKLNGQDKFLIRSDDLMTLNEKLTEYDINLGYIQMKNKDSKPYIRFKEDARSTLVNLAQNKFATYYDLGETFANANIKEPSIPNLKFSGTIELENSVGYGIITYPAEGDKLSVRELQKTSDKIVNKSFNRFDNFYKTMKSLVDGQGLDVANVSEDFAPMIWDMLSTLDEDQQKILVNEKIKLYTKLFLPVDIEGVDEPYKKVIFMPNSELREYSAYIGRLDRVMSQSSDVIREQLYNVFVEFMQKLSGDNMKMKELNKKGIDDLRKLLVGMSSEGFDLDESLGFRIIDIKDKNVVSEMELIELGNRITQKNKGINAILNQGREYPFSYTVGDNVYFWLETDLFF